jgi:hypothetical protein
MSAPIDVHVQRVGEHGAAMAIEWYSKSLELYVTIPLKDVSVRPMGPYATIAVLDRDGDGIIDAYRQPASLDLDLSAPTTRFEPLVPETRKLQSLWEQIIWVLVRERR